MGTKRIGLARMQKLIEGLKRELELGAGTALIGMKKRVTNITAAKTLTESDSGTVFTINADSGAYDITLPANALAGWYCTFILTDAHGSQDIDIVAATADTMQGVHVDASPTAITLADKITFVGGTAVVGDRVEVISDGTTWQCITHSGANGGITSTG